jgi:hypothetical protein
LFITEENQVQTSGRTTYSDQVAVWKITALWAFSEAALGGILHAFKVPMRGIFIGGSAAILISLIAYFSDRKGTVLKSTLLVILIKGIVSPHTPLTAYFAVFLQGFLGEVLFFRKRFFKISALLMGILTLLFSSMQKIFILTLVFGNTLWESIDQFASFVINKFIVQENAVDFRFSFLLVGLYLGLHVFVGILVGLFAGKLPFWIGDVIQDDKLEITSFNNLKSELVKKNKGKHKRWWQRLSGIIFISFVVIMVALSYLYPELGANKAAEIIIMILRAMLIMIIWYSLLGPLALKYLRKFLKKKENLYASEISKIIDSFPHLRSLVSYCWKISSHEKGYRRIKSFLIYLVSFLLVTDFNE